MSRPTADLLARGHAMERTNARDNLAQALAAAREQLANLEKHFHEDDTRTTFAGDAQRLAQIIVEVVSRAGELGMANRLAFLVPTTPEES